MFVHMIRNGMAQFSASWKMFGGRKKGKISTTTKIYMAAASALLTPLALSLTHTHTLTFSQIDKRKYANIFPHLTHNKNGCGYIFDLYKFFFCVLCNIKKRIQ